MKTYVVNGKGGSGKDTFEGFITSINNNASKISMIDLPKRIFIFAGELLHEPFSSQEKSNDLRKSLYELKKLLEKNDCPYKFVKEELEVLKKQGCEWVFIDAREKEDIERLVKDYQAKTILIRRDNLPADYGNPADNNVEKMSYDFVIENNGDMRSFQEKAWEFYEREMLGGKTH